MRKTLIIASSLLGLLIADLSFYLKLSDAQVTVTVTPAQADVTVNLTRQFTATVSGTTDQRVTWSLIPGGNGTFGPGTIDATGLYTAGSGAPEPPFVTVKATSVADPTAAGTASVIVRDLRDYRHRNTDDDLSVFNGGTYINVTWIDLPTGTTKIVLSRATSSNGPWTAVLIDAFPDDLTLSGSVEYTNIELIPPDTANDYFYKMDAFSATDLLLKSYAPVFVPKFVGMILTVSPTSIPPGGTITVSWSGIGTPTPTDWLGLYAPASADTATIDWVYVSCSKTPGSARPSGSCPFVVPALAAGIYEMRLFANDGFTRLATSNGFTVQP
jgi:hypothetical protein